ncbi:tyrosinase central domain protein [Aspergillus nomiae NRRL 13137]|uniref:Tyrosinase central domain protein n=1 Tax=Aspergillus nomiae NRRL (strain ATCC 15546 / NRRL 13137 / CBS 260.88 / M93) TaxID=1509407 RepID=A0A0L1JHV9_ASPN3|nr:tyrosinase central domain protein [Aspergillus nomiae NRRL 13137]KNG91292.1 tyrosinase central domain protein [Aspergillus nomiae NRRL 13137]
MPFVSFLIILAIACFTSTTAELCSPDKLVIRKEWRELAVAERTDYINAIYCLRERSSALPNEKFPGVRDRLDDFVATHINYTTRIHQNGLLLPWHRHFIFLWEATLREECGYKGSLPYWNWALDAYTLFDSPMLNGNAVSLSGNGAFEANETLSCTSDGTECLPRGTGNGCVRSGPFANFQVHLAPIDSNLARPYASPPPNAFDYKPHCLTRSLNPFIMAVFNNDTIGDRLLGAANITEFLRIMEPSGFDDMGAHGGGHHSIGGDMQNLFISPQDPVFMLHHAMIDRIWSIWQRHDPPNRRNALNGTTIIYNPPDAPFVTLDTVMEFGVLDSPRKVREVMDPIDYEYCYAYT